MVWPPAVETTYPNFSYYHASKWGIEGFCETVAREIAPFGIGLTIVEPGATPTGFGSALDTAPVIPEYENTPAGEVRRAVAEGTLNLPSDPRKIAEAIISLVDSGAAPFQMLGTRWTGGDDGSIYRSVADTCAQRDFSLFPILMAHHPHAWETAAACGIPLVIAGHTHGGQIMLTQNIGGGPIRFRYWTGLHTNPKLNSQLLISNGVGNWFPLRVNAPAEILQVVMHVGERKQRVESRK